MKYKFISGIIVFSFFLLIGALYSQKTFNGVHHFDISRLNLSTDRDPAAIKNVFDFSQLQGGALEFASKTRIIERSEIIMDTDRMGVVLGHFITRMSDGRQILACQNYQNLILTFEAEGVAVSGSKPTMIVESPCQPDKDINKISTIWIPYKDILKSQPADGNYDYFEQPVHISMTHIPDSWPRHWILTQVQLKQLQGPDEIRITAKEVRQILGKPLSFRWTEK